MKYFIHLLVLALLSHLIWGCSSNPKADESSSPSSARMTASEYNKILLDNTQEQKLYEGFYNTIEVRALFVNSKVQEALLQEKAARLKLALRQIREETIKNNELNSNSTTFFVSFYIPSRRLNNLDKPSTAWKIYLEANGERYEGIAKKRKEPLEVLQAIYPMHNRWGIAYDLIFNVPLSTIESTTAILTFASPVVQSQLSFRPQRQ